MADVRWEQEGTIQYHEYEPSEVRSMRPEMDAVEVAVAFIHRVDDAAAPTVGIVMALTAQERLETSIEAAIIKAREVLPRLVDRHRPEVTRLTENRNYIYTWDGYLLKRRG